MQVNGYTIAAHRPARDSFIILASVPRVSGGYEYVVARMETLNDRQWIAGYYTDNLVNAVNEYYMKGA